MVTGPGCGRGVLVWLLIIHEVMADDFLIDSMVVTGP